MKVDVVYRLSRQGVSPPCPDPDESWRTFILVVWRGAIPLLVMSMRADEGVDGRVDGSATLVKTGKRFCVGFVSNHQDNNAYHLHIAALQVHIPFAPHLSLQSCKRDSVVHRFLT